MAGIRQFDEDVALDRAMDVFWQRGYGATSMQDLAAATGILRGSLYHAYGDKQAIFLLVFERYKERFLQAVQATLDQPDLRRALGDFFRLTIASMNQAGAADPAQPGGPRGCLTTKTATDETAGDELIRSALRGLLDALERMLLARLSAAPHGSLTLPPKDAARLIVTATRGVVVMERVYHDQSQLKAIAKSLVGVLLRAD
jgi:TetR/AcrR family transcriptional repressor of nem operon